MEAMACGCCCIASNVGGNPELVTDGETGMLFPPGDAPALTRLLVSLIENGEERQRLADNAEASIRERFSTAAAARSMGEIYLSLV
jgi:glycosyltransferase involved in cell wall biosynthesis